MIVLMRLPHAMKQVLTHLAGRAMAVAADQPVLVVLPLELPQRRGQLGHRGERADPREVLLEGADESFGAAVALRLAT